MTTAKQIAMGSVVNRSGGLSTHEIDDCLVVADGAGHYYGLEHTARKIWQFLDRPRTVAELCGAMAEGYNIDRVSCERDVLEFLSELNRESLIEIA